MPSLQLILDQGMSSLQFLLSQGPLFHSSDFPVIGIGAGLETVTLTKNGLDCFGLPAVWQFVYLVSLAATGPADFFPVPVLVSIPVAA